MKIQSVESRDEENMLGQQYNLFYLGKYDHCLDVIASLECWCKRVRRSVRKQEQGPTGGGKKQEEDGTSWWENNHQNTQELR